jgi:hypothetical protein
MSPKGIDALRTHVGHAGWGANRYVGHQVPDLLDAHETLTGMLALGVGERRLEPDELGVLDDIAVAMTLADPRIWPLKLVRLVSAYGGCLPAVAAELLCLEEAPIGPWAAGAAASLLVALRGEAPALTASAMLEPVARRLRTGERLPGFTVPLRPEDERLVLVRKRMAERGRDQLPHWRVMEGAVTAARQLEGLEPNVVIAMAAACLDLGFTPRQIAVLSVAIVCHTDILPNAVEGSAQRPNVLRRLPDDRICYVGAPPRASPRAQSGAHEPG